MILCMEQKMENKMKNCQGLMLSVDAFGQRCCVFLHER